MLTKEQNELLTQTGPGTPMGDLIRRYWIPAFMSDRLPEPDGNPIKLMLLGERLVAFRDTNGRVGVLDEFCPHRRSSLALARNENCALQCVYHGWRIDADGVIVETPPEPPNSRFAQSIRHTSYPTVEVNGMVWIYMGPDLQRPPFPRLPFVSLPSDHVLTACLRQPCNYLQGLEGDVEAAHANWLHHGGMDPITLPEARHLRFQLLDPRPRHATEAAPWGLQTMMRFAIADSDDVLCLIRPFVMPTFTIASYSLDDGSVYGAGHCWVPIDDINHYVWTWFWRVAGPLGEGHRQGVVSSLRLQTVPENDYLHPDFVDGRYLQDREAMKRKESFSGFSGISTQDVAVQYEMGPIVDRTKENLASEDMVVVHLRRYLLDTLEAFGRGEEPLPALQSDMDHATIDHRSVIIDSAVHPSKIFRRPDWRLDVRLEPSELLR